ncbi:hypothetical protein M9H77_27997 [Catharanthus roseus]|uniref:Uncharacterized protein n=1 Tax=Catharanthus roseus TaxID=4058 RepID=A0ACC0AGB3_CATRO|nr:hypothetical protein M9H77_27997 [Catharanthus roseus]
MESEIEFVQNLVDEGLEGFRSLDPTFMNSPVKNGIQTLQKQFWLLEIFICYSRKLPPSIKAREAVDSLARIFKEANETPGQDDDDDDEDLPYPPIKNLVEKLNINPLLKEAFQDLSDLFLQSKCLSIEDLKEILSIGMQSLKDLKSLKPDLIDQIGAVKKRLDFIFVIFHFVSRDQNVHQLNSFFNHIEDWAKIAATIPFHYFVDDEIDERVTDVVSQFIEKFKPCTIEIAELYLGALMALKRPSEERYISMKRIAVIRFLDVLLEDLILPTDDDFEMLQHGLTFFISLLVNPPPEHDEDGKFIFTPENYPNCVNMVASLICSLYALKCKEEPLAKRSNNILHELAQEINQAMSKIRELQFEIPSSIWDNFPRTNAQGFLDFFFEGLDEKLKYETLTKYQRRQVITMQKLLISLKPSLIGVFETRNENEEFNDLQRQINSMTYHAEYVIDSCFHSDPTNYWQNVMLLSYVIDEIHFIETKLNQSRYTQMCNTRDISDEMKSDGDQSLQPNITVDDVMVGFTEEKKKIIDCLTGGLPQLDMIAIVGMPGQGKTTLARKIYNEPFVRFHFKKYAWRCISQEYRIKDILIDIVKQVDPMVDISNESPEDLAERLYRCLKGETYLIVLDDIWGIGAWKELKASFPNDENGSRIMLTSRIHKVAFEAKADCSLHELYPLSLEDSLELLQMKLSYKDGFPLNLIDMGRKIAETCKGLPLAIVLVAGLLVKADRDFEFWKQIAENLKSHVTGEGCMDVLEMSYKHLPDYLKQCFLYLAAFREDEQILAKKLIRYWISEGFIQKHENKSLEVVANEYLMDLVDRSLLFVVKRSSTYGIKKCVIHDLVRELCLEKAKEEKFLWVPNITSNYSCGEVHQQYRLFFHRECQPSFELESTFSIVRTLLFLTYVEGTYSLLSFKVLRVLDMVATSIDSDIDAITELVHLKHLAIRGTFIVPSSIVNLSRLEFLMLVIEWYRFRCLPRTIWNMKSLRQLYLFNSIDFRGIDTLVDESIQLDNLQTFVSYRTCSEGELKWILRRMPNIKKLGISLNFSIRLSEFLNKIESLNLRTDIKLSATEFNLPCTLRKLNIEADFLSERVTYAIGKLPDLEVLKLSKVSFEDQTWDVEDEQFLNLKYLDIRESKIEQWSASTDSFPQLQQLILKKCHELIEIPSCFAELLTLKVMKVIGCKKLEDSFQEIVAEQQDLGNEGLKVIANFSDEACMDFNLSLYQEQEDSEDTTQTLDY